MLVNSFIEAHDQMIRLDQQIYLNMNSQVLHKR